MPTDDRPIDEVWHKEDLLLDHLILQCGLYTVAAVLEDVIGLLAVAAGLSLLLG